MRPAAAVDRETKCAIVCNTFAKGEWGKEERKSNPYKKGDDIDIRIRAHDSKFQIFVDQRFFGGRGLGKRVYP
ncbi:galactoside-binding lectin [Ancylostoma duodenale]|uniref:Galectin n=1 Tax=Ancylostoma duodenale TaxID=51022 RepID=A0A0C2GII6_9BILA|nr:galactoside-binding lectin [Ancylostoma duodenale]